MKLNLSERNAPRLTGRPPTADRRPPTAAKGATSEAGRERRAEPLSRSTGARRGWGGPLNLACRLEIHFCRGTDREVGVMTPIK